jgi:hypothetical protein
LAASSSATAYFSAPAETAASIAPLAACLSASGGWAQPPIAKRRVKRTKINPNRLPIIIECLLKICLDYPEED